MMKRLLKIVGLCFVMLMVLVVGGVSWVIGTEQGFQQALALGQRFAPGTLQWSEASGKLLGPLKVRGLHYVQDDGLNVSVDALDFNWTLSALLNRELVVEQLHLDGIELYLPETAAQAPPEEASNGGLPDIALPVSIILNDIAVTDVALYTAGQDTPIAIERIALSGHVEQSDVQLSQLEVIAPQGELRIAGGVQTRDDYPMNLMLNWQADVGQASPLQGQGTVTGSLAALQIEHQIDGFAVADIDVSVTDVMQQPSWDASVEASVPEPQSLSEMLTGTPRITLQSSGTPDDYQVQTTLAITTIDTGPVRIDANVSGSTEQLDIHNLLATLEDSGGELSASGQIAFASLQGGIQGQWQGLGWPVSQDPQFSSATGRFEAQGSVDDFTAMLTTEVDGEMIPSGEWTVSLDGSATALDAFTVTGETLDGTINVTGNAGWADTPVWDVTLVTEDVNPGSQWAEFPGSIDLQVNSAGQLDDSGPQLTADITRLSGSLREQALSGNGRVQLAGERLTIDALNVVHGSTRLFANGTVEEQLALDFELESPDLRTLMPDLEGAVALTGTVSGSKEAPMVQASGGAENVAFAGNTITDLDLQVEGGLGENVTSTLSVVASGIRAGGQEISALNLSGEGSEASHRVELTVATDQGDLATALEGRYQDAIWQGTLDALELEDTLAGDWRLREPVRILAGAEQANASELCLDNGNRLGSLCVTGSWLADGESSVVATISDLSPRLADAYIPEIVRIQTELNGDVTASLGADGVMNADASLVLSPGRLTVDAGGEPVVVGLRETTINASLQGQDATVDIASAFAGIGDLNLRASISDPADAARLNGQLDIDFTDLTLISAFAPQVQQVAGSLDSNLSLGGTLQAPVIEGQLALRNFTAEVPEIAMLIEATQLTVTGSRDGTLLIDGQSRSGAGQLAINGNVNPGTQALRLRVVGENYEVANTAQMQAVVSPDMNIVMNDRGMQVKGTVTIPSAYINANGGNDGIRTVSASSDVVYVSEDGEEQSETAASQLELDVQVVLGDSIEVEAGDFRGRLEGDLRVQQTPGIAPRGTGTINVLNGDYVIYGQQLNMERGRILFSGGPVDNPSLDMEVAREVQEYDVVAGARIQGTAQSPRLELYSEPSMPDASILSFILLGQPPGTMGGSYTLGKYLTPDLYVSYGIGLFDAINTFNMRYKLTDKLAVEAESGSGSSADIIYTIER